MQIWLMWFGDLMSTGTCHACWEKLTMDNQGINTLLSLEEIYAYVNPVRISENSVTASVSIMSICNTICTFCIVPFTRVRERSRLVESIMWRLMNYGNRV